MSTLADENEIVERLREVLGPASARHIGDDAAFLTLGGDWAVTTDAQIEGVHFVPGLDPATVARRLLAVNLSDLAAVGAEPAYGLLAVSAPPDTDLEAFFSGLGEAAARYGVEIVGGDLSRDRHLHATLTLLGRRRPESRLVGRDSGRLGDRLWLGGPVGLSGLGRELMAQGVRATEPPNRWPIHLPPDLLEAARRAVRRHLAPEPQLELGAWLAGRPRAAAIDVSDGVARDLHRLAAASGVGAEVDCEAVRPDPGTSALADHLDLDPVGMALSGGEDYVLLFALPPEEEPPQELGARALGSLTAAPEVQLVVDGRPCALEDLGWDHFAGGRPAPVSDPDPT